MTRIATSALGLALVSTAMLPSSPARAQQVELVAFRTVEDGVVIDIKRMVEGPKAVQYAPVSSARLADDFATLALDNQLGPAVSESPAKRPSVFIPLWMRTGRPDEATTIVATSQVPRFYVPSACPASAYAPRTDLPAQVEFRRARYYPMMSFAACEAGIPAGLFDALIAQESRYDPRAVSPKGAIGMAQLMPATATGLGVANAYDPLQNMRGGARYLRSHLDEFGRVDLALAAYNAGPGRVRVNGRVPPFRETIDYVSAITRAWSAVTRKAATVVLISGDSRAGPSSNRDGIVRAVPLHSRRHIGSASDEAG